MASLSCFQLSTTVAANGVSYEPDAASTTPGIVLNGRYAPFKSNSERTGALKYGFATSDARLHVFDPAPPFRLSKHGKALVWPPNEPQRALGLVDGATPWHAFVNELYCWMAMFTVLST